MILYSKFICTTQNLNPSTTLKANTPTSKEDPNLDPWRRACLECALLGRAKRTRTPYLTFGAVDLLGQFEVVRKFLNFLLSLCMG